MIIDFHTHSFPDFLAPRAMAHLIPNSPTSPCTDGTVSGLKKKLAESGIDRAVVLNIATKPNGEGHLNLSASELIGDPVLIPFGSVNPFSDDPEKELCEISRLGFAGIKLHPDYQNFFIDDEKVFPVYEKAARLGLIISFHTGFDGYSPEIMHAPVSGCVKVARRFEGAKIVFAHLGGAKVWDDVEKYLAGADVMLDTAMCASLSDPAVTARIIRKHSADRVLMGSDCPWESPADSVRFIRSLDLTENEKEKILSKNAVRLLGL